MPTGITTNMNCGLGKSKSKGQPGNLAHNRREFDPYNTDPNLAVNNIFFANSSLEGELPIIMLFKSVSGSMTCSCKAKLVAILQSLQSFNDEFQYLYGRYKVFCVMLTIDSTFFKLFFKVSQVLFMSL